MAPFIQQCGKVKSAAPLLHAGGGGGGDGVIMPGGGGPLVGAEKNQFLWNLPHFWNFMIIYMVGMVVGTCNDMEL